MQTKAAPPTREETRREYSRRVLARRELFAYAQYMLPMYTFQPHQILLAEKLEQVKRYVLTKGKEGIGNLLVEMPPQHFKTTTVSHLFPSHTMGQYPDWPWITTSYNDQKATGNSRAVRDFVSSNDYRKIFGDMGNLPDPVELSSDTRSVSEWKLAAPHRGGMIAAGVGGGATGYPSKISIIDDPFKNRKEADSVDNQESIWEWYETSIYTRRQVGSAIILFHTRWNVRDLAGRLISQMITNPKADKWDIVFLPALALQADEYPKNLAQQQEQMAEEGVYLPFADQLGRQPGEALCSDVMPQEMLESIRDNMTPYNWISMFQQMPTLRSGQVFERKWFKVINEYDLPAGKYFAIWYWDKAATPGGGDFSAGVLMAKPIDPKAPKITYILEAVRGQWAAYERHQQMKQAYARSMARWGRLFANNPVIWHQRDPAAAGLDSAQATNMALLPYPSRHELTSAKTMDEVDPWIGALQGDGVRLLSGVWNQPFIEEHITFPKGKNDDWVDVGATGYKRLMLRGAQREPQSYSG